MNLSQLAAPFKSGFRIIAIYSSLALFALSHALVSCKFMGIGHKSVFALPSELSFAHRFKIHRHDSASAVIIIITAIKGLLIIILRKIFIFITPPANPLSTCPR
ncbi:uncharacterized protein C8R40DRAFT_391426 [Lentinula edodes]|uniref:uncharacterized protein n=1 Tax=Lentinula edodes TaxID=5353 RepID=UPI001E8D8A85|nr:uncharacterized protein C8R40DRAFT_391426 [Lentinula edodes]KAH7873472.1 hypothetical protein C8R40DRAFT_391426 [Lentinula edodes]